MKLTKKAISRIDNQELRLKLALALGYSEQWVGRVIDANKVNGPLTTVAAIQVIKENTNLKDNEILEQEKKAVA